MMMFFVKKYLQNQYIAGLSAGLTLMISGGCVVWPTPIVALLDTETYNDVLIPMTKRQISLMISLIEFGLFLAIIPSGIIANFCGRKLLIAIAGPFIVIGWAIILMTREIIFLYLARIIQGFGLGILHIVAPIYLAEISEAKVRGGVTALFQVMWYFGFLYQYIVGSYLSYDNSAIFNIIFSTIVFIFFFVFQQESPYYLMMKKCDEKATRSLMLLRGKSTFTDVETEFKMIRSCVETEKKNKMKWSNLSKLTRIDLKILLLVSIMAALRVSSGTLSISSYVLEILHSANWNNGSEKVTMIIYGSVTIVFVIISTLSVDLIGRRPLLIFSCLGAGIIHLCLGSFFFFSSTKYGSIIYSLNMQWIPAVALIGLTMVMSVGLAPVTQVIQSELCPTNMRTLGSTTSNLVDGIFAFLCLYSYEIDVELFGMSSNFFLFSVICFAGGVFTYIYVPEIKGKTFLEINDVF